MVYSFGPMLGMHNMSGNAYQNMKERYGCGHSDFGQSPIPAAYPFEIVPKHYPSENHVSKFVKFLRKCFE